jgi:hypothetical protein
VVGDPVESKVSTGGRSRDHSANARIDNIDNLVKQAELKAVIVTVDDRRGGEDVRDEESLRAMYCCIAC